MPTLPDEFKVGFDPQKVRKSTLTKWLAKTNLLERLAKLRQKNNQIFLRIGSLLKGQKSLKELRKIVTEFKEKKSTFLVMY